jgi:tRNA pseudouridine13 synthase
VLEQRMACQEIAARRAGRQSLRVVLREVQASTAAIEARLQAIATRGVPNIRRAAFRPWRRQRRPGLAMFAGRRVRREQRTLLLSAARSELFNRVLGGARGRRSVDKPLEGEVWMLDGSPQRVRSGALSDALAQRLGAFDIHPTGPLWGRGNAALHRRVRSARSRRARGRDAAALRAGLEPKA